jgi:hypothetical protein
MSRSSSLPLCVIQYRIASFVPVLDPVSVNFLASNEINRVTLLSVKSGGQKMEDKQLRWGMFLEGR